MPEKIIKIKYKCKETKKLFKTEQEARDSEQEAKKKKLEKRRDEIYRKYFPSRHEKDSRYRSHCVDCGKLLIRWATWYDGHRNERGDIEFEEKNIIRVANGIRCKTCADIASLIVVKAIIFYLGSKEEKDELEL